MKVVGCSVLAIAIALTMFGLLMKRAFDWRFVEEDITVAQLQPVSASYVSDQAYPPASDSEALDKNSAGVSRLSPATVQAQSAESAVLDLVFEKAHEPFSNDYYPAKLLTQRPRLLEDIDPAWYLIGIDLPTLRAIVLINEYGDVDELLIDTAGVSPMLREDLRARFRAARFIPGHLDGRPVKAMLPIAVELN